jgi:hypothetical protein
LLKRRLDLCRNRKETARDLVIDAVSLKNWEERRTEIEIRFYPRIIQWLGYDPLPTPSTRRQQIEIERTAEVGLESAWPTKPGSMRRRSAEWKMTLLALDDVLFDPSAMRSRIADKMEAPSKIEP